MIKKHTKNAALHEIANIVTLTPAPREPSPLHNRAPATVLPLRRKRVRKYTLE